MTIDSLKKEILDPATKPEHRAEALEKLGGMFIAEAVAAATAPGPEVAYERSAEWIGEAMYKASYVLVSGKPLVQYTPQTMTKEDCTAVVLALASMVLAAQSYGISAEDFSQRTGDVGEQVVAMMLKSEMDGASFPQ